jgi:hypothetical protein
MIDATTIGNSKMVDAMYVTTQPTDCNTEVTIVLKKDDGETTFNPDSSFPEENMPFITEYDQVTSSWAKFEWN